MAEISNFWSEILDGAGSEKSSSGRRIVADFIALKATNDEIRSRAIEWLISSFTELAAHANQHNIPIEIERKEPHNFAAYGANMVGLKTSFRHGLRCLTVEAGWTRMPGDGFMRGGALAVAHIRHFGLKQHAADLALLRTNDRLQWCQIDNENTAHPIQIDNLVRHMAILVGKAA